MFALWAVSTEWSSSHYWNSAGPFKNIFKLPHITATLQLFYASYDSADETISKIY